MSIFKRKKKTQYLEIPSKHITFLSAQGTHIGMGFGSFGLMLPLDDAQGMALDILAAVREARKQNDAA